MTAEQLSELASIYKTRSLSPAIIDLERVKDSDDFIGYKLIGGVLVCDIDYYKAKRLLK